MNIALGIVVLILSLICWIGQVISVIAPKFSVKIGLTEKESEVDRVFYIEEKCEAIVDSMLTWIMIPASILLILDNPSWVYFGLTGGGIYIYFGLRITLIRIMLSKRGVRIGAPSNVKAAYVFGPLWALSGLIFIFLAIISIGV